MQVPSTSPHCGTRIIQSEHNNLSAVINGMKYFVDSIAKGQPAPDLKVFRAMLFYIDEFPDRVHHPKEERYLFARLRNRTTELDATLTELGHQHEQGTTLVRNLEHALLRYEFEGALAFPVFRRLVDEYAKFYFSHMRLEEKEVLPAAARFFTQEDWAEIDSAFAANADPLNLLSAKDSFEKLFSLIANITPTPIGLGPEVRSQWTDSAL